MKPPLGKDGRSYLFLFVPYRNMAEISLSIGSTRAWGFQVSPDEAYDVFMRSMRGRNRPRTPRYLPSFYRDEIIPGAYQTCSVHQLTGWPSVLCVEFASGLRESEISDEVGRIARDNWNIDVPTEVGFHRSFNDRTGIPDSSFDIDGHFRVGGNNEPPEFSDQLPVAFSWGGQLCHQNSTWLWSPILRTNGATPGNNAEASILAMHVDQITTSIGNLWFLWDRTRNVVGFGTNATLAGFDGNYLSTVSLSNLAVIVECAGAASTGQTRRKSNDSAKKVVRTDLGFDGSLSDFVVVIRHVSALQGNPLNGFFQQFEADFRTVAPIWRNVRNYDYHEPPSLLAPDHDKRRQFVGVNETKVITLTCYRLALEITSRLGAVPTTGLVQP